MVAAQLHKQLIMACKKGSVKEVEHWLNAGAEPNFNITTALNALDTAVEIDNHQIISLLLEHGAIVKEAVIQRAIEKEKNYFNLLLPDFKACKDERVLSGVLQAAMNLDDFNLAKKAINQGAKPASLLLFSIRDFGSTKILELLIKNGLDIHADNNMLLTEWLGACLTHEWGKKRAKRTDFLAFIADYYLDKPESIERFKSWRETNKPRLFRLGLDSNNFNMMKFALEIGVDKNLVLNSALYRCYEKNRTINKVVYEIIEYILYSDIELSKLVISNAVCFKYTELLTALNHMHDLEYAYEMSLKYENDDLCDYFIDQGVSKEAQYLAKMRISAIKGNVKALRKAINEGANVKDLDIDIIVDVINKNQIESLKSLYDSGLLIDSSFNQYLNDAMNEHKAYETVSYLIELGLDITHIKTIPLEYKAKYPSLTEMREKRFSNIFDYTIYLVKEVHPKAEGKEKEEVLKRIAELSSLPYVLQMSKEKALEE